MFDRFNLKNIKDHTINYCTYDSLEPKADHININILNLKFENGGNYADLEIIMHAVNHDVLLNKINDFLKENCIYSKYIKIDNFIDSVLVSAFIKIENRIVKYEMQN